MRRFLHSLTGRAFLPAMAAVHLVLRAAAAWGRPIERFPDSTGYEKLAFTGANERFWPVPLVYELVGSDTGRVVVQVLAGAAAWIWLARVLSRESRFVRAMPATVLVIGLVPQVVRYDLAVLSESLGITLTVAAIAATVEAAARPTVVSRAMWLVAMTACAFVRPTHLVVVWACAAVATWTAFVSRGRRLVGAAAILVALGLWGVDLQRGNQPMSDLNMYTILMERVVANDARWEWFSAEGMPDLPAMREATGYDFAEQLPADVAAYVDLPDGQAPPSLIRVGGMPLARWVREDGWRTYAKWIVTHPADTRERITSLTPRVLDPPNDDFLPLESRTIVPRGIFRGWWLWILVGVAAMAAAHARPGARRTARALVAMSATAAVVHVVGLLASGIEHPRHGATVAVVVRVLALCAVATATGGVSRGIGRDEPAPRR